MKNLFIWLIRNLVDCGEIKTASLFDNSFSSLTLVTEDGTYNINIIKRQDD